jgi:hypothetical protein
MRLEEYLVEEDITIAKLARKADMSFSTVKNAVSGKNITLENAYKLSLATKGKCTLLDMLPVGVVKTPSPSDQ